MQPEIKEMFERSKRLNDLPTYWGVEVDKKIKEKTDAGHDIISLGIGDPDLPTPSHIIEAGYAAAKNPDNHRYPTSEGTPKFKEAVAYRIKEDSGKTVNPKKEITALIGSKEGLVHTQLAFVNPGDYVLYPVIGYAPNWIGTIFAGGIPYPMPMTKENGFIPDLNAVPSDIAKKAKLMILNHPNNPTGTIPPEGFHKEVVDFALDNKIKVVYDEAYDKICFDGYRYKSFLETEGAMDVAIVLKSCSKTYNMTGWRIGYAVGNENIISGIIKSKSQMDSGQSQIIQEAAIAALRGPQDCVKETLKVYQERREIVKQGLENIGINYLNTPATFYFWCWRDGQDGMGLANEFLERDVVVTPGKAFERPGTEYGDKYIRISFTQNTGRIKEAFDRMETKLYA